MKALIKEQQLEEGIHAKEEYQHGLEVDVKIYNQESYGEEKHPHGEERQEIGVVPLGNHFAVEKDIIDKVVECNLQEIKAAEDTGGDQENLIGRYRIEDFRFE